MEPFDLENKKTEVFLRHSNYAKVHEENFFLGLQRLTPSLWQELLDRKQECSLYLVGARNGLLEIPFLKAMAKQRGSIKELYFSCQGISPAMREEFFQRAIESGLGNLAAKYQVVNFEEPLYVETQAHLVVALYEWLDITAWRNTPREHNSLVKFRNSIQHRGAGLMVFPYQAGDRFLLLQQLNFSSLVAGEEIVEELTHLQVRHQAYILETTLDTECCFQRGRFRPNQDGEKLISYLLQLEWSSLSAQTKKNVGEKITELRAHYNEPKIILQHLFVWIFPGAPHQRDLEKFTGIEAMEGI